MNSETVRRNAPFIAVMFGIGLTILALVVGVASLFAKIH